MTRQDLYAILGVGRDASAEEIKKTYRRLAQKYHPDRNPENKKAEERFKEISVAHDILSDPEKRQLYDEFGMEALQSGFDPSRARAYRRAAAGPGAYSTGDVGAGWSQGNRSFSDILNEMFSGLGRQARGVPGSDLEYPLQIDLLDALRGQSVDMTVERPAPCPACNGTGRSGSRRCDRCHGTAAIRERVRLTVKVPPGVDTGSRVRVAGKGEPGQYGGPPGDLYLIITVKPHPFLERRGRDLYLEVPITVGEAMRGATITVPRLSGKVNVKVPPRSQSGQLLRLKGQGVSDPKTHARGDFFVRLMVHVPTDGDGIEPAIDALEETYRVNPRHNLHL